MSNALLPIPNTARESLAAPPVLLGYQLRWIEDRSPLKVGEKGRRTGLTWAEAADDVLLAAMDKDAGGMNVYYVGTDKEMTEEYIEACSMWCKAYNHAAAEMEEGFWDEADEDKHIKTFTIRFPNSGNKIVALASRPRKLRGRQGRLVGDEAAFQDDLMELLKAALAFLIWGGDVRLISTHDGEENPFNSLLNEIRSGKRKGTIHHIPFRLAVDEGLYERVCMRTRRKPSHEGKLEWVKDVYSYYGDAAQEELDCIPSQGSGIWLSRALIEARMVSGGKIVRWRGEKDMHLWAEHLLHATVKDFCDRELLPLLLLLDRTEASYIGEDFARSVDLTVLAPLQLSRQLVRTYPFLVELSNAPFKAQEQIFYYICDRLPRFSHGMLDARGNGQYLAEVAQQRYGVGRITQVMLSETWYRENTAPLKAAFEDDSIRLPKDDAVLSDMAAFRKVRGVPMIPAARTTDSSGQKRHGDAGIAVLLGYAASRLEPFQAFGYEPVRPEQSSRGSFLRHADEQDDNMRPVQVTGGFRARDGVM